MCAIWFKCEGDFRVSIVKGFIGLAAVVAAATELLSFQDALRYGAVAGSWIAIACALIISLIIAVKSKRTISTVPGRVAGCRTLASVDYLAVAVTALILVLTLTTALVYPPNNWDSMTYHMARVARWVQEGNVHFFPTSITRQNYQMPLSEFFILHLQILSRSDLFANLVQWFSFLVLLIIISLVVREIGGSGRDQVIAAFLAGTLPMAVLQSSGTQNDVVVAAFCLSFMYFLLRWRSDPDYENAVFAALSFGLALFTKGTAYLFCGVVGLSVGGYAVLGARPHRLRSVVMLVGMVALGLSLSAGHYLRNYEAYGHPLSTANHDYVNRDMSPAALAAGLVRNAAIHTGFPIGKGVQARFGEWLTHILGDQADNPKNTWPGTVFGVPMASRHDSYAGNTLHFVLALIAVPYAFFRTRMPKQDLVRLCAIAALASAVLFCVVFKWQPWQSRLHTPIFMLAMPVTAMGLTRALGERKQFVLVLLLSAYAMIFVLLNGDRPLLPLSRSNWHNKTRNELYFANKVDVFPDYRGAVDVVLKTGTSTLGLYLGEDDWEYPVWVFTGSSAGRKGSIRMRHVGVPILPDKTRPEPPPAYVFSAYETDGNVIDGVPYRVIFRSKTARVLARE